MIENKNNGICLPASCIADAIICARKRNNEDEFATLEEVNYIKKLMNLRMKEEKIDVRFSDEFLNRFFFVDTNCGIVTKNDEDFTYKRYLADKINDVLYDYSFIDESITDLKISKEHKIGVIDINKIFKLEI